MSNSARKAAQRAKYEERAVSLEFANGFTMSDMYDFRDYSSARNSTRFDACVSEYALNVTRRSARNRGDDAVYNWRSWPNSQIAGHMNSEWWPFYSARFTKGGRL